MRLCDNMGLGNKLRRQLAPSPSSTEKRAARTAALLGHVCWERETSGGVVFLSISGFGFACFLRKPQQRR